MNQVRMLTIFRTMEINMGKDWAVMFMLMIDIVGVGALVYFRGTVLLISFSFHTLSAPRRKPLF